jgi:hypothetical protein
MSKVYNGVTVFDPGENDKDNPAIKELSKVSLGDVRFPFGFFLVDQGGKTIVIPATKEDRAKTLRKAFPDMRPELASIACDYDFDGKCPQHGDCSHFGKTFKCGKVNDPSTRYYGCGCIDFF